MVRSWIWGVRKLEGVHVACSAALLEANPKYIRSARCCPPRSGALSCVGTRGCEVEPHSGLAHRFHHRPIVRVSKHDCGGPVGPETQGQVADRLAERRLGHGLALDRASGPTHPQRLRGIQALAKLQKQVCQTNAATDGGDEDAPGPRRKK